ncbi:MAG: hypothetical protein Q4F17_05755 [Eubacteriales bacterium]|nr:hypothetical protein [Eubacteriales bacterium]
MKTKKCYVQVTQNKVFVPLHEVHGAAGSSFKKTVCKTEKPPGYTGPLRQEFYSTTSDFVVILKKPHYNLNSVTIQDTTQVSIQDKRQSELVAFCAEARSGDEMQ